MDCIYIVKKHYAPPQIQIHRRAAVFSYLTFLLFCPTPLLRGSTVVKPEGSPHLNLFTFCCFLLDMCIHLIFDFWLSLSASSFSPPLFSLQTLVEICRLLPQTKVPELVVSLVALAVLIVVKEINTCYRQKLPPPIPIELIVVSPPFALFPLSLIQQVC